MSSKVPAPPCVRCGEPQQVGSAPFCSNGCKDRDLLDWLDERHVIFDSGDRDMLDNMDTDA